MKSNARKATSHKKNRVKKLIHEVYLGLGSNMGDRLANIRKAVSLLSTNRVTVIKHSSVIETDPVGGPPQPKFLNAVVKIKTSLTPEELLHLAKSIEDKLGRKPSKKNYPRPIDIDILLYNNISIKSPTLTIPHPRMQKRDFVMRPLLEIEPDILKKRSSGLGTQTSKTVNVNIPRNKSRETKHAEIMKIISSINRLRSEIALARKEEKSIGFIPTMGALHEGHLSLIRQCRKENDLVVVSIFVNPIQFGPKEDYAAYPRNKKKDSTLAYKAGCDILFYPNVHQLIPSGFNTHVEVPKLSKHLCGERRPGHFKGVATIVAKLFNIVMPDKAYFGQKDFQQLAVIRKMVSDLNFPVSIKSIKTVREDDGLAMSSRNVYLSPKERLESPVIYQALLEAKKTALAGNLDASQIKELIRRRINDTSGRIDYIECVDEKNLSPIKKMSGRCVIAVAVFFGKTRLIDNIVLQI